MAGSLAILLAASPVNADERLQFPVDCDLGHDCFVQNYVDRNPGPGVADFTCGPLTYDGHNGTDIRLADRAVMEAGVDVLSASTGVVVAVRDGMQDHQPGQTTSPDIQGRECGNGVLIQRADGWRFQYCHLQRGSLGVRQGQAVAPGDRLARVGFSGNTQFPHLHFTIRDQAGRTIDPFDARQQDEACSLRDRRSLWRDLSPQSYQPGGPMTAGFLDRVPEYREVKAGTAQVLAFTSDMPALVFWAHFFGVRAGDTIVLRLVDPLGATVSEKTHVMTKNRAVQMLATGRKRRDAWSPGQYTGTAELIRDGAIHDAIQHVIEHR